MAKYPEEAGVYNDLGLCYQRRGMLDESVAMLRKATQLQPERPLYHNNLATVLVDAERNDEALAQLLAVNPPAVAHYNLGCLLHRKGNDPLAADHFQQALVDDPTMRAAQQWLAKLGPQPPPDPAPMQVARRQKALQPAKIELGPSSNVPEVRVDDTNQNAKTQPAVPPPTAAQPTAPPRTAAQPIAPPAAADQPADPPRTPAQTVSTRTVRQRPISVPVDEIAPQPQTAQLTRYSNQPASGNLPATANLPAGGSVPATGDVPAVGDAPDASDERRPPNRYPAMIPRPTSCPSRMGPTRMRRVGGCNIRTTRAIATRRTDSRHFRPRLRPGRAGSPCVRSLSRTRLNRCRRGEKRDLSARPDGRGQILPVSKCSGLPWASSPCEVVFASTLTAQRCIRSSHACGQYSQKWLGQRQISMRHNAAPEKESQPSPS